MADKLTGPPVRIIGSRELHQTLPVILRELENNDARYVLTVHGKPKAVLIGASTYLELLEGRQHPSEQVVGLQLSALLGTSPPQMLLDDVRNQSGPHSILKRHSAEVGREAASDGLNLIVDLTS